MDFTSFTGNMINNFENYSMWPFFGITVGLMFIVVAAIYIYYSLAWQTIAQKQKYKNPWLAWIPFANGAMILQMGNFGWGWIFLVLIPILGWIALYILIIIAEWRVFEKQKYPGWLSLSMIIPRIGGVLYLIIIGVVAWYKKK